MSSLSQLAYLNCKTSFPQLTAKHLLRSVFCMFDQIAHLSWPALCHIIFTLTITMWACIIKLSLPRLPSLRFTSDSPTDQTNPFSGDNYVRKCVSRFHLRGFERWERASSHNPLAGEQWDEPHPPSLAQGPEASNQLCNSAVMSCTVSWQVNFTGLVKGGLLSMPSTKALEQTKLWLPHCECGKINNINNTVKINNFMGD